MMLGPLTIRRPPASIPGTGSRRQSIPGISLPTVPALHCMGEFMASTGAVSVAP